MNGYDWIVIALLLVWVIGCIVFLRRRKRRSACSGCCGNCSGCNRMRLLRKKQLIVAFHLILDLKNPVEYATIIRPYYADRSRHNE